MFERASALAPRNVIGEWVVRGGIAFFFVSAGADKFTPGWVTVGLALLACTMGSAALILIFLVGRPADSFISPPLCIALTFYGWNRMHRDA